MNSISLWFTAAGASLMLISLVVGKFSTAGWTGYPPYSGIEYSPAVGTDYWIWALLISGVGSTLTGINFVTAIVKRRAPDPEHLGARIGITSVLHTWGSAMTHHPHVHMIVPGGGRERRGLFPLFVEADEGQAGALP